MYVISSYTLKQAKRLGVEVKISTNKTKKIDVYRNGKKIASVGGAGYSDYYTYIQTHGRVYANKRRELYKIRHEKDRHVKWSNGFLADQLLW
jgi:hypothetical protein